MLNYNCEGSALQHRLVLNSFYKDNYVKNLIIFLFIIILHLILNLTSYLIFENFENINYSTLASKY